MEPAKARQLDLRGRPIPTSDGKTFDDYDPYNGEVYAITETAKLLEFQGHHTNQACYN